MKNLILILCLFISIQLQAQYIDNIEIIKNDWLKAYNIKNTVILTDHYHEKGAIFSNKKLYQKSNTLNDILKKINKKTPEIHAQQRLFLQKSNNKHYFELVDYGVANGKSLYSIIDWEYENDKWQREIEIIYQKTVKSSNDYPKGIDDARRSWEKYSNAHQPEQLVKKVYASDATYYNNGKSAIGTQAITKRYSYMKNEKWKIDLFPKCITMVQPNLAYEIGEYRSPGIGHYVLIWKKTGKKWRAVFDFNF